MPLDVFFNKLEKIILQLKADFRLTFVKIDNRKIDNRKIIINNIGELSQSELKKLTSLQNLLSDGLSSEKYKISEEKSQNKTAQIQKTAARNPKILEFIIEYLPPKDHSLWLSGLSLREKSKAGKQEEVQQIKEQMMINAGWRGASIANLANAGYLEDHIMEIQRVLLGNTDNNSAHQKFLSIYEEIVDEQSFIVFVGATKDGEDLITEIENKVKRTREAARECVYIHAIGRSNVRKAKDAVDNVVKNDKKLCEESIAFNGGNKHLKITIEL